MRVREKELNQFDQIIGLIYYQINQQSPDHIHLRNLSRFNYNDLLIFEISLIVASIRRIPIYIHTNIFKLLRIKFIYRKRKVKIHRTKYFLDAIDHQDILNSIKTYYNITDDIFKKIYKTYYDIYKRKD